MAIPNWDQRKVIVNTKVKIADLSGQRVERKNNEISKLRKCPEPIIVFSDAAYSLPRRVANAA